MIILIENLLEEKRGIGLLIIRMLLILLALIICTCNTPRLMLGSQTSERLIDSSSFFGKPAKPINGVMECAILKTVGPVLASCLQQRQYIRLQLHQTHGLGYCPNLVLMQRKCSQTRWSQSQLTTRFFSNQSKTEWTDQNRNLHIESPPQSLPKRVLPKPVKDKY